LDSVSCHPNQGHDRLADAHDVVIVPACVALLVSEDKRTRLADATSRSASPRDR
jgi:hypothetical protein